jgi:hypothetical protein
LRREVLIAWDKMDMEVAFQVMKRRVLVNEIEGSESRELEGMKHVGVYLLVPSRV